MTTVDKHDMIAMQPSRQQLPLKFRQHLASDQKHDQKHAVPRSLPAANKKKPKSQALRESKKAPVTPVIKPYYWNRSC
jgi:hypothetical protein